MFVDCALFILKPQVTLPLLKNCGPILDLISKKVEPKPKYRLVWELLHFWILFFIVLYHTIYHVLSMSYTYKRCIDYIGILTKPWSKLVIMCLYLFQLRQPNVCCCAPSCHRYSVTITCCHGCMRISTISDYPPHISSMCMSNSVHICLDQVWSLLHMLSLPSYDWSRTQHDQY